MDTVFSSEYFSLYVCVHIRYFLPPRIVRDQEKRMVSIYTTYTFFFLNFITHKKILEYFSEFWLQNTDLEFFSQLGTTPGFKPTEKVAHWSLDARVVYTQFGRAVVVDLMNCSVFLSKRFSLQEDRIENSCSLRSMTTLSKSVLPRNT